MLFILSGRVEMFCHWKSKFNEYRTFSLFSTVFKQHARFLFDVLVLAWCHFGLYFTRCLMKWNSITFIAYYSKLSQENYNLPVRSFWISHMWLYRMQGPCVHNAHELCTYRLKGQQQDSKDPWMVIWQTQA